MAKRDAKYSQVIQDEKELYEVLANVSSEDPEFLSNLMQKLQTKDFDKEAWERELNEMVQLANAECFSNGITK